MKGQSVIFSTGTDNWRTPQALFNALDKEFHFTLDAAADTSNHKCPYWFGPGSEFAEDALGENWMVPVGSVWMNPPYSHCADFISKAAIEAHDGHANTVALVPSRTDTQWWHAHVWDREWHRPRPGVEVRFIKGRVKFELPDVVNKNSAPFPSVVVVFHKHQNAVFNSVKRGKQL